MAEIAISHFAYFTLLFLAAFPFRAWLLQEGLVRAQVQVKPSAMGHVLLIFACVSVLILGLRPTWRAYSWLILATFGRRAAK